METGKTASQINCLVVIAHYNHLKTLRQVAAQCLDAIVLHEVEPFDDLVANPVGVEYLKHLLGLFALAEFQNILVGIEGGADQRLRNGVA